MTVYELCERDVVNVTTGQNLGKVDDISFEPETATSRGDWSLADGGQLRLFCLLTYLSRPSLICRLIQLGDSLP